MREVKRETYEDTLDREPIRDGFYKTLEDVSNQEIHQTNLVCEEFTHDFLKDYYGKSDPNFNFEIKYINTSEHYDDYAVIINWCWRNCQNNRSVLFQRNRNHITFEDFEAQIKSYLFDLIIMIINL